MCERDRSRRGFEVAITHLATENVSFSELYCSHNLVIGYVVDGDGPVYTFEEFITGVYLPFCRRSSKESTNCSMRSGARNYRTSSSGRRWTFPPAPWPIFVGS